MLEVVLSVLVAVCGRQKPVSSVTSGSVLDGDSW